MLSDTAGFLETGLDAVALKPAECDLRDALDLPVDRVTIDYEGREYFPDPAVMSSLATEFDVRVTTPVRADGFDPTGDDSRLSELPTSVGRVLVAGHPAYLEEHERERAIAPRLGAAIDEASDPWVGTEGIERLALAADATQFELLAPDVERELRRLRAAGYDRGLAVYAPTVLSTDEDVVLDTLGAYVARRGAVAERLPAEARTDARATGRARDLLLNAAETYALVGDVDAVRDRVRTLQRAGADHVVGYPARGLDVFRE